MERKPFFVRHNKLLRSVHPDDVLGLSTEGNYTRIHLVKKGYLVRSSMSAMLKKLPADMFIRVHRSFVVSIFWMDSIDRDHLLIGKDTIPIGKKFYKSMMERLDVVD